MILDGPVGSHHRENWRRPEPSPRQVRHLVAMLTCDLACLPLTKLLLHTPYLCAMAPVHLGLHRGGAIELIPELIALLGVTGAAACRLYLGAQHTFGFAAQLRLMALEPDDIAVVGSGNQLRIGARTEPRSHTVDLHKRAVVGFQLRKDRRKHPPPHWYQHGSQPERWPVWTRRTAAPCAPLGPGHRPVAG